jgi:diacylglycerol kinase (ATP)
VRPKKDIFQVVRLPNTVSVAKRLTFELGGAPTLAGLMGPYMRALLVHNPSAGTREHNKSSIIDALHLADIKADYVSTKDDSLKQALDKTYDLVVTAGGDGTIAHVFTHLAHRSIPIGILPLGSANNIARSLGIAGTPAELAEKWRAGHVQRFHLMEIADEGKHKELCAEGFGIGLTAALIERRAKGKKADGADDIRRGRRAFTAALEQAEPLETQIKIDGKPWKYDLISIEILNIPFSGPALPLAHGADPSDKLLDVVGFETNKRDKLREWIGRPHHKAPPAIRQSAKRIEVRWRGAASRLDSAVFAAKSEWQCARLHCDPEALHILVPARHPATRKSAKSTGT